ncbi:MAG TPA: ABC transporter ATP-binding protein [Candidatus Omnitrophica bacterium]|nr:ABC transporter ATP-binding protein [Candidatus Omnitrophota bacterium]
MAIIELQNVSKKYTLKFHKGAIIRDILPRIVNPYIKRDFWALREINLKVEKGEVLGIIGDNGAGKSTLLSIIARITMPTDGNVYVDGRVHSLLSLGAGFHRELSGEDNIYLNGLLLGLRMEEIRQKINKIVDFSELGGFIKQPIYTYSSGMLLRLGFAIAVFVDFDILLLDEILAVGDLNFQEKCLSKIKEFIKDGKTILIASQSMAMIRELCTKVILLDGGKILEGGEPEDVINSYEKLRERKSMFQQGIVLVQNIPEEEKRIKAGWGKKFGNGKAEILKVEFIGENGRKEYFQTGEPLTISVDAEIKEEIYNPHFGIAIFRDDYVYCHGPNTRFDGIKIKKLNPGRINFQLHYPEFILNGGNYKVSVAIWDEHEIDPYVYHCAYYDLKIHPVFENRTLAKVPRNLKKHILSDSVTDGCLTEPRVDKIVLYDKDLKEKEVFLTGEWLGLKINLTVGEESKFQIDLLKSNGILCDSFSLWFNSGSYLLSLEYPEIPFLSGDFIFKLSLLCPGNSPKILAWKRFTILAKIRDHGLIFMPHSWELRLQ